MEVIFDTNVLVSGLLRPDRPIARLVAAIGSGLLVPVFDERILDEYTKVLERPRLARKFGEGEATLLLDRIVKLGIDAGQCVVFSGALPDETDRPFVEVALTTGALLVSGNARHFQPSSALTSSRPQTWWHG
jgi:putative PIN family toxin of toxin-antitoxin system